MALKKSALCPLPVCSAISGGTSLKKYSAIGKASLRVDGADKVSGKAFYTADRALAGMAWGKVLRSPIPHGRITRIDTSRAEAYPGVFAVLTARDVSSQLFGRQLRDMPILARDRVRFVGEKVAAIAAESPEVAEEAANLIEVGYEELPAVFDPAEAMREDAPTLHEGLSRYRNAPDPLPGIPNVHSHVSWQVGDCQRGFAESDFVFEQTFTTQRAHQAYLEPHACVVGAGAEDSIRIRASNKVPFQTKQYLAEVLMMDPAKILFEISPVGGDFGGKGSLMDIPMAYYLARATGRPVKMVMSYGEELTAGNPRHPSTITIKTGVKKDGRLWARTVKMVFNSGAYAAFKPNATINLPGARHGAGAYHIPNVTVEALSVYTNSVPSGHMRGPGDPQVYFAVESHTDHIARELKIDPLELRRLNILMPGNTLPTGVHVDSDRGKVLLDAIKEKVRVPILNRRHSLRGRGLALCFRDIGPGEANVEVGVNPDGKIYLLTTVTDTGVGAHTILRQIVAETLGIPGEGIVIISGNTDSFENDIALGGSRVTYLAGRAAAQAAQALAQRMKEVAAGLWQGSPDLVTIRDSGLSGPGKKSISFAGLAARSAACGQPLKEVGRFATTAREGTQSFGAQIAEIEIEPDTGQMRIVKIVSVQDVGTVINPLTHQGQIEGGMIQGVGFALMEDLLDQDGKIVAANLGEYKIPSIRDIPPHETVNIYDAPGPGPFGSKPIGENTSSPTAAAIANAVYDAIGIQIKDLPITSEKIYSALKERRAS
ncbi:MAG: xanthine dehydrogenase family protein molybdopterin-binding subunit [Deltaproteobacteria bacterium]|nr:xanthine dehydrogenase family protein molybdopterin-binding subunit [Deltaproteobacteria bacterium]